MARSGRGRMTGAREHPAGIAVRIGADGSRRVDAGELLGGDREVLIAHAGQLYRLRLTASGKLILTK